jgi:hypothetical protein
MSGGFTKEAVAKLFDLNFDMFIDNGLSVVAVDEQSKKVVGLFTCWDPY